jgi:hypothetical protein
MHGGGVFGTIDAGDAEADRRGADVAAADGSIHHAVQDFFDFEFAGRLEVRTAAARFADDSTVLIGQQAHRFRTAGIYPEHVHCSKL